MSVERGQISADQYVGGLLVFFYRTVRRHLLLVIFLPVAVAALAFTVVRQFPPVYGVQASIRVGRVDGAELVNLQDVLTRVNSAAFKQRALQAMNLSAGGNDRAAQMIAGSLTARPETPDTLAVTVRAPTEQQVRQALDATVQLLNEEQDVIRQPLLADITEQLATIDANIVSLSQAQDSLSTAAKVMSEAQVPDPVSAAFRTMWLLDLVSRNEERLTGARAERRAMASRLGSSKTYPTTLVDGTFLSPGLVSAPPTRIAILAGAVMFVACVIYALMRGRRFAGPRR